MSSTNQPSDGSYRFTTASDAKFTEDRLRAAGISFRTQIVRTKKRGLEYVITQLGRIADVGTI